MAVVNIENSVGRQAVEPRRGTDPGASAYLKLVGTRVRAQRKKLGMSRKTLSQKSGVSERYLAELERGSGNASLLVLRSVATALGLRVDDLAYEASVTLADNDVEALTGPIGSQEQGSGKIVLVGLRGAGKSTLGRSVAARMGVPFVELNDEVERVAGMDVSEIFAEQGEKAYRDLEHSCLETVLEAHENVVVATGGGIVTDWSAFEQVSAGAFVVWVKTSAETLFERARASVALRNGVLSRKAMMEIRDALAAREHMFAKASAVVDTTDKASFDAIEELTEVLRKRDKG